MYRSCRCCRRIANKLLHTVFHLLAMPCIALAFVATYDSHTLRTVPCDSGNGLCDAPIPNFYSLHSWMGLATMGLFALQVRFLCKQDHSYLWYSHRNYIIKISVISNISFSFRFSVHRRFLQFLASSLLRVCDGIFPGQSCADTFYVWNHDFCYGNRNSLFWTDGKSLFYSKVCFWIFYCELWLFLPHLMFSCCMASISQIYEWINNLNSLDIFVLLFKSWKATH